MQMQIPMKYGKRLIKLDLADKETFGYYRQLFGREFKPLCHFPSVYNQE